MTILCMPPTRTALEAVVAADVELMALRDEERQLNERLQVMNHFAL